MATGRATLKALVFAQQLEVLAQLIDADLNAVVRKVAFDLDAGIVLKTPVDTGRLRSSWRVSIGEVDLSVAPPGGGGGAGQAGPTLAAGLSLTENFPDFSGYHYPTPVFITNALPYAEPIEHGHSKQAPAGMVAVTAAEVAAGVNTEILSRGGVI